MKDKVGGLSQRSLAIRFRIRARTLFIMFAAACSDAAGPKDPPCFNVPTNALPCVTDQGLVISDPIQTTEVGVTASASLGYGSGAGDSVVYVSLAPGSEVDGSTATVGLLSSLSSVNPDRGWRF
jgi:hypothetical protein